MPCIVPVTTDKLSANLPAVDDDDPFGFSDEDDEAFLREWDEAEREAVSILRAALAGMVGAGPPERELAEVAVGIRAGVAGRRWPFRYLAGAAGWAGAPPVDDRRCCVEAAGALIAMRDESGMGAEEESAIMALELGDWLGAVIGVVRAGPGAPADDHDLIGYINRCPEIEGEVDPEDQVLIESAFDTVVHGWAAAGVVDENRRLTRLGTWALPRALAWAWGGDFDAEP